MRGIQDAVAAAETADAAVSAPLLEESGPVVPTVRRLRIAMIGQKGIPATYGGIEHHVEELGARLVARGHDVTVYCRSTYGTRREAEHRGMVLRHLPAVGTKHLDAITHSAFSTVAALAAHHDILHFHALGPGLLAPLPRYGARRPVVLTVHGLDNERAKWGRAARAVLGSAHWMSGHVPNATVTVSRALADHYGATFGRRAVYIPNGAPLREPRPAAEIVRRFGLQPGSYALFVGRLVPEKAPDQLVRAFRNVPGNHRLVVAGDSSFTDGYVSELRRLAASDPRVVLVGYVHGTVLEELYSNARVFVLPSLLEGLPLTLLEASGYGVPIVASDIPPHREVLGADCPGARTFATGDEQALADVLGWSLLHHEGELRGAQVLRRRVTSEYSWDEAASRLEEVYLGLLGTKPGLRRSRNVWRPAA